MEAMMFRIKICGVTNVHDALMAVRHGADALGVNFWEHSPRRVSLETARSIADVVRGSAQLVGVFVNSPAEVIHDTVESVGLNVIQLHGDEDGVFARQLGLPVVQAVRGDRARAHAVLRYLTDAQQANSGLCGFLVDADRPGRPGGTGRRADWAAARQLIDQVPQLPIGLAGGLTPENVARAIRQVQPAAVDVASGVESAPGQKSEARISQFIVAASEAFLRLQDIAP
jgi:phosphoribosylanthranilate isomerase